jgi:hypothetical protein
MPLPSTALDRYEVDDEVVAREGMSFVTKLLPSSDQGGMIFSPLCVV